MLSLVATEQREGLDESAYDRVPKMAEGLAGTPEMLSGLRGPVTVCRVHQRRKCHTDNCTCKNLPGSFSLQVFSTS